MVLKLGQKEDFLYWESRREREKKKGREGRRKGEVWQTYQSTDRTKSQGYECSVN